MKRSRRKIMGFSTRHFLLLFFLLGMLRLFDHMVVSGANYFLLAKLCQKEILKKQKLKKKTDFGGF
jgi:hypothetical protein